MKKLISMFPMLLVFVLMFLPFGLIYGLIIHFTGQFYTGMAYLVLFLFLFCFLDIGVGTIIDSFLNAVTDLDKSIFVNKIISVVLSLAGSYIVISALDYFMGEIELSIPIRILIVAVHTLSGLMIENLKTDEDGLTIEGNELDPEVVIEIEYLLQKENWVKCVDIIKERHPDIPKSTIVMATRKLHMDNKNSI